MKQDYFNKVVLVVIAILLAAILATLVQNNISKDNRNPREWDPIINRDDSNPPVIDEDSNLTQQKPTAMTLAQTDLGGFGCFGGPGTCNDEGPIRATLNGSFNGNGDKVTTWFEYWGVSGVQNPNVKMTTAPQIQTSKSGKTSEELRGGILLPGSKIEYRIVVQNSAGITYGNTVQFSIPIP